MAVTCWSSPSLRPRLPTNLTIRSRLFGCRPTLTDPERGSPEADGPLKRAFLRSISSQPQLAEMPFGGVKEPGYARKGGRGAHLLHRSQERLANLGTRHVTLGGRATTFRAFLPSILRGRHPPSIGRLLLPNLTGGRRSTPLVVSVAPMRGPPGCADRDSRLLKTPEIKLRIVGPTASPSVCSRPTRGALLTHLQEIGANLLLAELVRRATI
jgi:hypothetical protein